MPLLIFDTFSSSIDPLQTNQGNLSFKAYRLTKKLMALFAGGEKSFTPEGYYFLPI